MQFPAFKSKGTAKLQILNYCHEMKINTKKAFEFNYPSSSNIIL